MRFPVEDLKITEIRHKQSAFGLDLELALAPFHLNLEDDAPVETRVSLDGITLPSSDPAALAGQGWDVPVNPAEGYVDGSVYIEHAHHPVDLHHIAVGTRTGDHVPVTLSMRMVFSFEGLGDYEDADWQVTIDLPVAAITG